MRHSSTSRSNKISYPALTLAALLSAILLIKTVPTGVRVIGVIDGDTLVLEGKEKVRLRYVDAPELEFCGGHEAKAHLEKLVIGKKVRIEQQIPDQYGRGMALVYIGKIVVNKEMLASGWVRYHHDKSKLTDELKFAFAQAKEKGNGLFTKCQSIDFSDKEGCMIKGNIDDNSDRKNYHTPDCAQYKFTVVEKDMGEGWFCTEKEAIAAGFTKAKTCK